MAQKKEAHVTRFQKILRAAAENTLSYNDYED